MLEYLWFLQKYCIIRSEWRAITFLENIKSFLFIKSHLDFDKNTSDNWTNISANSPEFYSRFVAKFQLHFSYLSVAYVETSDSTGIIFLNQFLFSILYQFRFEIDFMDWYTYIQMQYRCNFWYSKIELNIFFLPLGKYFFTL